MVVVCLVFSKSRNTIWTLIPVKLPVSDSVTRYKKMSELQVCFHQEALDAFRLERPEGQLRVVASLCARQRSPELGRMPMCADWLVSTKTRRQSVACLFQS